MASEFVWFTDFLFWVERLRGLRERGKMHLPRARQDFSIRGAICTCNVEEAVLLHVEFSHTVNIRLQHLSTFINI